MLFRSLSFAAFLQWLFTKSKKIITAGVTIIILLISLNLVQTYQYRNGIIHWDHMTKEAYWNVFLKTEMTDKERIDNEKLMCNPNYEKEKNGDDD